jgi:hypothetical protein
MWTRTPPAYALSQRLEGRSAAKGHWTDPLRRSTSEDRTPLRGAPPPSGSASPSGSNPRPPSDLHAQVLSSDLMSLLEHRVVSSPVVWPSHTHIRPSGHSCSLGSFIFSRNDAPLFSPRTHFRI